MACSHFGAVVFGSDLDLRVLSGCGVGRKTYNEEVAKKVKQEMEEETKDEQPIFNIYTNFKHYGLPMPEIFT